MYGHTLYFACKLHRADITPQAEWTGNLVIADNHFNWGVCVGTYGLITLTLSPPVRYKWRKREKRKVKEELEELKWEWDQAIHII